ncbi:MAG: T9SS type A sorting domain-containing protein [Chloroherpetonaceae bacterium]
MKYTLSLTRLALLVFFVLLFSAPTAQLSAQITGTPSPSYFQDVPEEIRKKKAFRRFEHYFRQRANADGTVPIDVFVSERLAQQEKDKARRGLSTVQWRNVGPSGIEVFFPAQWERNSGRVRALAIHPTNPDIAYIGAAAGGIWKTTNGGETWLDIGYDLSSLTFGAIAIDETNPNIVYAGAGEFTRFSNNVIFDGRGLYKSTDGGATWNFIDAFGAHTHFSAIRVSPHNPNVIFASLGRGYLYVQNPGNEGVWRSTNGGATWVRTLALSNASDVLPSPAPNSSRVYAAGQGGVRISTDNGLTWSASNTGLPSDAGRVQLAISPANPSVVYAAIYLDQSGRTVLYQSTNEGATWTQKAGTPPAGQGWYDLLLAVNPENPDEVYFGDQQLYRSEDGGNTASFVGGEYWNQAMHVDFHIMAFAPSNPDVRYVGNDGGINRSTDGGITWLEQNDLPTLQLYRIASHPTDSLKMLGGTQDNGNFRTTNGGATWEQTTTGDGMECFYDRANPTTVFMSVYNANIFRSTQNGSFGTFSNITSGLSGAAAWIAPFFQDVAASNVLYVATDRLFRSSNLGDSWTAISNSFSGAASSVSQSPVNPNNFIAVASETGPTSTVWISTNGGVTFQSRSVPGEATYIKRVLCHPSEPNTMFVLRTGFSAGNKLYRTTDFGVTWTNLSSNLPNIPHSDLFIDPLYPNEWYVANDFGVHRSLNSGGTWEREADGMPITPALHFSYFDIGTARKLRVGTHGRSVFETPLRTRALVSNISSITFSATEVGRFGRDTVSIRLTNNSALPITVTSVSRSNPSAFYFSLPATPFTIQANGSTAIQAWFQATTAGVVEDTLVLNTDNAEVPQIKISLSGRGIFITPAQAGWLYAIGSTPQNQLFRLNEVTGQATPLFVPAVPSQLGGLSVEPSRNQLYSFLASTPYSLYRLSSANALDVLVGQNIPLNVVRSVAFAPNDTAHVYALSSLGIGSSSRGVLYKMNLASGDTTTVFTTVPIGIVTSLAFSPTSTPWITSRSGSLNRLYKLNLDAGSAQLVCETTGDLWTSLAFNPSGTQLFALSGSGTQQNRLIRVDTAGVLLASVPTGVSGLRGLTVRLDSIANLSAPTDNRTLTKPAQYTLKQNYPNPFNPLTVIGYQLPTSGFVKLDVFDVLGRVVATLVNEQKEAGSYEATFNASALSSGVYFYRLQSGEFVATKKMLLVK